MIIVWRVMIYLIWKLINSFMKKIAIFLATVTLLGFSCQPAGSPMTDNLPPAVPDDNLLAEDDRAFTLRDGEGNAIPDGTVKKEHNIGQSPCPDSFGQFSIDFPPEYADAEAVPVSVSECGWFDLPDVIRSGELFNIDFNCNIQQFDNHAEGGSFRLDFSDYARRNPGLEHLAGTPEGGTFFIVMDTCNGPCPDFSLPYICCSDCPPITTIVTDPPPSSEPEE